MNSKKTILIIRIATLVMVISAACDTLPDSLTNLRDEVTIQASGVVEAKEVVIAPEIGGRIAEVWAKEGDKLAEGDALFRIEDELLESQKSLYP